MSTAAGVARDQAEADEDMSVKQRLILAGGSAVGGASEMVDNEVIASAMEVTGVCVCVCVCSSRAYMLCQMLLSMPHPFLNIQRRG